MAESFDTDKDLNRFRGLEINGAFIDEANEIQEQTFDKIIERSGSWFHSKGCPTKIVMTANPSNNWLKKRIYDKWKTNSLPNGIAYVPARIFDNPHIPKEYLESLKMLPRFQYEVFVGGNWDIQLKVGGEFYKCFELDKHVKPTQYDPNLPLHISWDDNVNPYLPCGIFQIEGKTVRMIDEICGVTPNNTVKAVCNEIIRKFPNHTTGMFVYGDATAEKEDTKMEKGFSFYRLVCDNLKQYNPNLRVLKSNPSVVMRGNWINTILEKEIGGIQIILGEHCKTAINDFVMLKESADGTKNKEMETDPKTKVRYQKYGHFGDCFIGETLVKTDKGDVRIDSIKVGDLVLTRKGYRMVLSVMNKGIKEVDTYTICGNRITCTKEHKVWTKEYGFKEVSLLINTITFCIFDENIQLWKESKSFITKETFIDTQMQKAEQKEPIIQEGLKLTELTEKSGTTFINTCVKLVKFLKGLLFIILMAIHLTMTYLIWNALIKKFILLIMPKRMKGKKCQEKHLSYMQGQKQVNGINQQKVEHGILSKIKKTWIAKNLFALVLSVRFHLLDILILGKTQNIAHKNAGQDIEQELIGYQGSGMKQETAKDAIQNFQFIDGIKQNVAQKNVQLVYDITVDEEHEFFANNVLVHNCFDYLLCSAFANEFMQYQSGGAVSSLTYGKNKASKNSY